MLNDYIVENKEQIQKEVYDLCENQEIDYIFTLAKKGTFLFDIIFDNQNELFIDKASRFVRVYSDRVINKKNDFSFLKGKKILLFDDSVRTGKHFKHTIDYLKEKIKESCKSKDVSASFVCYSIMQCPNYEESIKVNLHDKDNGKKIDLEVFNLCHEFSDYYKFCVEESEYFQDETNGNSVDLPIFNVKVPYIWEFREYLELTFDGYKQLDIGITHEKNDLDVIVFRNNCNLKPFFNDFLISSMCKLKYKKEDDGWNVVVTAYALTNSIKYETLRTWYNNVFEFYNINESHKEKVPNVKNKRNIYFVKMYRYINYLIGYYIGMYFSNILKEKNIILEYNDSNAIKQFGKDYNNYIKSLYDNYGVGIFTLIDDKKQDISLKKANKYLYNYQEMTEHVFKEINMNKKNKASSFLEIGGLKKYYSNESNLELFDYAIVCQQERFAISNEVELSEDKVSIYRGFAPGECSMALMPYRANVFYGIIYELYNKSKKQFSLFKRNYDLFIKRIDRYFVLEDFYKKKVISKSQFDYLSKYFDEINELYFNESIEAMEYILEDKSQYSVIVARDAAKFILNSDDFDF